MFCLAFGVTNASTLRLRTTFFNSTNGLRICSTDLCRCALCGGSAGRTCGPEGKWYESGLKVCLSCFRTWCVIHAPLDERVLSLARAVIPDAPLRIYLEADTDIEDEWRIIIDGCVLGAEIRFASQFEIPTIFRI